MSRQHFFRIYPICPTFLGVVAAILALVWPAAARAERPATAKLLPKETVLYVRLADTRDFLARLQQTALGKVGNEEGLKPLLTQLYGSTIQELAGVEEQLGLSIPKLLAIPQGEVALAVVAPEGKPLSPVLLVELGDDKGDVKTLVERGETELLARGGTKTTETIDGTVVSIYDVPARRQRKVIHFEKDGAMVVATDLDVAKGVLESWRGGAPAGLASNLQFSAIMNRCQPGKDETPQFAWYVDPVGMLKAARRGDDATTGIGLVIALLPILGLDGLKGAGGTVSLASGDFDLLVHVHVLLDNPRTGVLEALNLGSGDVTPENFVPGDVGVYGTLYWDVEKTYQGVKKVYDLVNGDGSLEDLVRSNLSRQLGVDVEKEIIPALGGRFSQFTWYEKPARLNSQATVMAVKLKDPAAFQKTLDEILDKFKERLTTHSFGGVTYRQFAIPRPPGADANPERGPPLPEPCLAVLDDYLVVSDRPSVLQHAILARSDETIRLAGQLDYKLIASRIKRQAAGNTPGWVRFSRPEEQLRALYDLAASEENRKRLSTTADNIRQLKGLSEALNNNPLPPFAVLARHLAPGGGMFLNEETGYHYTGFVLRRTGE